MRTVVLGCRGMVGFELNRSFLALGEVIGLDRSQADLSDPASLATTIDRLEPDVIVNAAAYTEVDRAEVDRATAERVNGEAVARLAEIALDRGALLVHYSTDYVFDGSKDTPWTETDATCPVNAYGETKLLGERALAASKAEWLCIRTSWVYASRGKNFVRTILRLAEEREELRVVADQRGAPTAARNLADVTAHVVRGTLAQRAAGQFRSSVLHYTAAGETTWHGVAVESLAIARDVFPERHYRAKHILPIVSDEFPTPARRPKNSRLAMGTIQERFGVSAPDWRISLRRCIEEMKQ